MFLSEQFAGRALFWLFGLKNHIVRESADIFNIFLMIFDAKNAS